VQPRGEAARVALPGGGHAAGDNGLDVGVPQAGPADDLDQDAADPGPVGGRLQADPGAAGQQAVQVVVEAEEPALPDRDYVVAEVRPDEPGVQDRDPGFGDWKVLSVDPCAARTEPVRCHGPTVRRAALGAGTGGRAGMPAGPDAGAGRTAGRARQPGETAGRRPGRPTGMAGRADGSGGPGRRQRRAGRTAAA